MRPKVRGCHAAAGFLLGFLVCGASGAAEIRVEGTCTLIDAIRAANTDAIVGGCPAGSGGDHIVMSAVVQLDSVYEELANGPNGLPRVETEIVLEGRGYAILRPATAEVFRFFEVAPSGVLTLDDLLLFGGYGDRDGGAIYNDDGVVHLEDSTFWFNEAEADGGAVFTSGTLTAEDSDFLYNVAGEKGGAVYSSTGVVSLLSSTFEDNEARRGGAINSSTTATLALNKCEVKNNEAIAGGGVESFGDLTVVSSLFVGNEAVAGSGGGLRLDGALAAGESYVVASTFSGNEAYNGGAIYSYGRLIVELSTFSGNKADGPLPPVYAGLYAELFSEAWVGSTIMANSVGGDHCNEGFIVRGLNNFGCHGTEEVTGLDPTLADNGGRTETHALYSYSNAIDEAGACDTPADQRGVPREDACDSGAFEYGRCDDSVLRDHIVSTHETPEVCEYFWLGPSLHVFGPAGHLNAIAGKKFVIRNGFSVRQGAQLTITLDPSLLPD